ncbi:hypothetical protein [Paenibacillus validus]|uniref:hypothetical protein n=1 Tax=Paenibacillus validus TaxID=44253 RepID=UPI003D2DBFA5
MLKLLTKHNQNVLVDEAGTVIRFEFTLYRLAMYYYVQPFSTNFGLLQGIAKLDAYGIIVRLIMEQEGLFILKESDKGPMSAQQNEVNRVLSTFCKMEAPSIRKIDEEIACSQLLWSNNKWGSPFGKAAERTYMKKYKKDRQKEIQCHNASTNLEAARIRFFESLSKFRNID